MAGVDLKTCLQVIRQVIDRSQKSGDSLPATFILLDSSAMAFYNLRKLSDRVEVFASTFSPQVIEELEAELQNLYGPGFKLDMTPTENIRGNFLLRDIEERSILVETVNRAGESFQIRALPVEDLLLVKLDADRPKDREDIPLLAPHTSCEALLLRFNQMVGWYGNRDSIPSYAERFLEVLAEHFDAEPAKIIPLLNVTSGVKQMLVDTLEEGEDLFP